MPEAERRAELQAAEPGERAVVILSGGPDSAVVLYLARREGYRVDALTFDYGQLAEAEIGCAKELARLAGAEWARFDLSGMKELYRGATALTDEAMDMTGEFASQLVVPFRNGIMIAIAVAYADSIGASTVLYGAQQSDAAHYPDCREGFVRAFEEAARTGTDKNIRIKAPLISLNKSRVLKLGKELGVPFKMTWSCYRGGSKHCGRCESCLNRKRAFGEAGMSDPTVYSE